eukprot:8862714-Pyramimonas_sp.AAC.1
MTAMMLIMIMMMVQMRMVMLTRMMMMIPQSALALKGSSRMLKDLCPVDFGRTLGSRVPGSGFPGSRFRFPDRFRMAARFP